MKLPDPNFVTYRDNKGQEPKRKFKCGLISSKRKYRAAKLSDHVTASLPAPSPELDLYTAVDQYGMDGNNQYGCCGFSAVSHTHNTWTANVGGKTVHFDLNRLISDYLACAGGDNGVTEDQLVSFWKSQGICGTKIVGDTEINKDDPIQLRQGLEIFGNLQIGVLLAEQWTEDDTFWDGNAGRPGYFMGANGDAGHWIVAVGTKIINGRLWFVIVTWGGLKYMSAEAISQYAMFTNSALSEAWVNQATAKSPTGIDVPGLIADMDALNGPDPAPVWPGPIPVSPPPDPVSPTPPPAPQPPTYTLNVSPSGVYTFSPTKTEAQVKFGSWLSDGIDVVSKVAQEAATLADKYGPGAMAVLHSAANLAIHRDLESALALKDAVEELVQTAQGNAAASDNPGFTKSPRFGFGPADVIGWIQLAQLVAELIRSIRNKPAPAPAA